MRRLAGIFTSPSPIAPIQPLNRTHADEAEARLLIGHTGTEFSFNSHRFLESVFVQIHTAVPRMSRVNRIPFFRISLGKSPGRPNTAE